MQEPGWELAIRFEDQSPNFAHGFECGQFWAEMKTGEVVIERATLEDNLSMIRRMADYMYYRMEATSLGDGWFAVRLEKTPANPVKQRLTVIPGGLKDA